MEVEDNDFLTNQFFQLFHDQVSQTKNYQLEELVQLSNCINIIKNGDEIKNLINSARYILNHIEILEFDDSIEIGPFIQNYALDFENIDLSVVSIHILGILIRNISQREYYEPIKQEFIQNAKEKSEIIFSYCQGELSPQINDLIFSFISFSNEMFNFSLENQLIQLIIDKCPFYLEKESLEQMIQYLELILNITKLLSNQKEFTQIIYETISDIYNKVSQIMNLNITHLYDLLLEIFDAIFGTQPDHYTLREYNSIFEPLFENFFKNYASILSKDCNESFFLNILLNFSKKLFANKILKEYPINDFFIHYLLLDIDDIDNCTTNDIHKIKLSWDIERNLIFQNPDEIKCAIKNNILDKALEICQKGTIEMKCFVTKFLSNIINCVYDQQIFQYVEETNLLEILLSFVEYLSIDYSEYIIKSIAFFISNPKISYRTKNILKKKASSVESKNSLENFIDLYPNNDISAEGTYLLEYFGDFYNSFGEEEEEKAEIMFSI